MALKTQHDHEEFRATEVILGLRHDAGGDWRQVKGTP